MRGVFRAMVRWSTGGNGCYVSRRLTSKKDESGIGANRIAIRAPEGAGNLARSAPYRPKKKG